jgi:HlyD family secretion protein
MRRFIFPILLVAALVGGFFLFRNYQTQQQQASLADLQTVEVSRGSLTATVGATGIVRSNQSAVLIWQTSGTIEQTLAKLGDSVTAGQSLATLKQTSLQQNIILAYAELITAQEALKDLKEPPSELVVAQARQAITQAEKGLEDAEQRLANLKSAAKQADIDSARATVVLAGDKLEKARQAFAPYENKSEDNLIRASLQAQMARAQNEYDAAVRRLNNLLGTANLTDLAIAESNLEVARARLEDAQTNLEDLLDGPSDTDIAAVEARILAAQATINLASIQAPFAGTITQAESKPGDQTSPGLTAFRLDDLSRLLVEVSVSEVDINRIQVGQGAVLTFDGIQGQEYQGEVTEVARVGSPVQGVVEYAVTVELTGADEAVRPGMTAAVNIVVQELEDVLLVPNRAVRVVNGERVVYILQNGQLEPVPVVLGVSSETFSEALETDLQVGDQVVLNPPQVFEGGGPPPFVQR